MRSGLDLSDLEVARHAGLGPLGEVGGHLRRPGRRAGSTMACRSHQLRNRFHCDDFEAKAHPALLHRRRRRRGGQQLAMTCEKRT